MRVPLSAAEADFYEAVRSRSQVQFDAYVARDKALANHASVLELLLRLRQASPAAAPADSARAPSSDQVRSVVCC